MHAARLDARYTSIPKHLLISPPLKLQPFTYIFFRPLVGATQHVARD